MKAYQIKDVKNFMGRLLGTDAFDSFLLAEASITTYNTFVIDGHIEKIFLPVTSMMILSFRPIHFLSGKICVPYALI